MAGCKRSYLNNLLSPKGTENLKVFITTWNMGNAEAEGLSSIFTEKNAVDNFDIFAIGLQESTYSMKGHNEHDCIGHLSTIIEEALGEMFFKVEHCYRAQLQLFLFARKSLQSRISNVQQSIENTGFLHVFPNKGGLLVTLHVDGTKMAFISCHLAAHEGVKFCEERNASIVEILGGVRAGDKRFDVTEQFHHVFWMGDMNYRTNYNTKKLPANTKKNLKALAEQSEKKLLMKNSKKKKAGADTNDHGDNGDMSKKDGDTSCKADDMIIRGMGSSDRSQSTASVSAATHSTDIDDDDDDDSVSSTNYSGGDESDVPGSDVDDVNSSICSYRSTVSRNNSSDELGTVVVSADGKANNSGKTHSINNFTFANGGSAISPNGSGLSPSMKKSKSYRRKRSKRKAIKKLDRAAQMTATMELIVNEQWEDILRLDELNREMTSGRVLNEFIALQPAFPPTFKRTRNLVIERLAIVNPIPIDIPASTSGLLDDSSSSNCTAGKKQPLPSKEGEHLLHSQKDERVSDGDNSNNNNNESPHKQRPKQWDLVLEDDVKGSEETVVGVAAELPATAATTTESVEEECTNAVAAAGGVDSSSNSHLSNKQEPLNSSSSHHHHSRRHSRHRSGMIALRSSINRHTASPSAAASVLSGQKVVVVTQHYHRKRIPSYTDRILYKSMPAFTNNVKPLFFESCEAAVSSDHKPVRAGFDVLLSRGEQGIYIDKQLLSWKGKISSKTSGRRSDVSILNLTISDLRCNNLEEMDSQMFGGGSDPYIIITSDPPSALLYKGTFTNAHEGIKSKMIKHCLDPVWKDDMHLSLASIDLAGLANNASLIFSVWDEDLMNADDVIGVMTIPLRNIIQAHIPLLSSDEEHQDENDWVSMEQDTTSDNSRGSLCYEFFGDLRLNSEIMGKLGGKIRIDGGLQSVLMDYQQMEAELQQQDGNSTALTATVDNNMRSYSSGSFITLHQAQLISAYSSGETGCSACQVS